MTVELGELGLDGETYQLIAREYRRQWSVELLACRPDGVPVAGDGPADAGACLVREQAIAEAVRWGEPTFQLAADGELVWAMPLMRNALLLGGLVARAPEALALGPDRPDLPRAATALRRLTEEHNLTNAALLESHRQAEGRERLRAEAIHALKTRPSFNLRQVYLLEEPDLVAAIRHGERGQARDVLNRLLVGIHHLAGDRLGLVKGLYLELVVTVCRTAVEAGGAPESLLETNLSAAARLAAVEGEDELAGWLRSALESALDAVESARRQGPAAQLAEAIRYLQEHYPERLTRDEVAAVAHLSPAHFSRQVKATFGRTFTELLTGLRVERAAEMLSRTDKPIAVVALATGFTDQSYFTKVFRRAKGRTPSDYRTHHASREAP